MKARLFILLGLTVVLALLVPGGARPTVAQSELSTTAAPDHAQTTAILQSTPVAFSESASQFDERAMIQLPSTSASPIPNSSVQMDGASNLLQSDPVWSSNVLVNDDIGTAEQSHPDIAVDEAGNAYAIWTDRRNGDSDIYFSYRPVGGSWGPNVRVNDDTGNAEQDPPTVAVDGAGNVYAVWTDRRSGNADIYFSAWFILDQKHLYN